MNNVVLLVSLIAGGGILGGVSNYLMNRNLPDWKPGDFWKSLVVGIAASAVVPLFLKTVSSELVKECLDFNVVSCFVFFGFCTLASIFSARFLTSIADRVLRDLEEVKQTQAEMAETQDAIVELNSDDQGSNVTPLESFRSDDDALESTSNTTVPLTPEERLVRTMSNGKFPFRTVKGLSKDTGMDVSGIENMLQSLESRGVVKKMRRNSDGETIWMLNR